MYTSNPGTDHSLKYRYNYTSNSGTDYSLYTGLSLAQYSLLLLVLLTLQLLSVLAVKLCTSSNLRHACLVFKIFTFRFRIQNIEQFIIRLHP